MQMGGNIGTAILSLEPPSADRVHVIEMSSFQIDLTPGLDPSVGVLMNITPDHLDRHGTMEQYAAIKERLIRGVGPRGRRHRRRPEPGHRRAPGGRPRARPRARTARCSCTDALTVRDGIVRDPRRAQSWPTSTGSARCAAPITGRTRPSRWRWRGRSGLSPEQIQSGLSSFPGLPHRMEEVGRRGPVLFVNDSKATNADSTEKALTAFRDIHWILGGKAKDGGIFPLVPYFERVAHAYLIGAASDAFAATLEGAVPYTRCETLEVAVPKAAENAAASGAPEPVVLLSPACASYDQFRNFEIRGNRFRELVQALP